MKRLVVLLLIYPFLLFGQDFKNIEGLQYVGMLEAGENEELNPGTLEKNGNYYIMAISDTNGLGYLHRYQLSKSGDYKLKAIMEVGCTQNRAFAGQLSLTQDNQIMVFTSSFDNSWDNNELCISTYDAKDNKYEKVRLLGEINDVQKAEAYPYISADGLRLYYILNNEVYFTSRSDLKRSFGYPRNISIDKSTNDINIVSCWLSLDELNLYITGDEKVYKCSRTALNEKFSSPEIYLQGFGGFISGYSMSEKNKLVFIYYSGSLKYPKPKPNEYFDDSEVILIYKIKKN
mgnify:FL=1